MNLISNLTTLIKRFKPRRYTTLRVEFPIALPRDFSPDEYSDTDLLRMFSDEIESKALAVYTILVNKYGVKPKRLRGTIIPVLRASSTPRNKIVIKCLVPEDAPIVLIDGDRIQMFGGDCVFFT